LILIDANLLIYAHVSAFPQHKAAHAWLDGCLNSSAAAGLPWVSLMAFVRLVSNPRIFSRPESVTRAWTQVEQWLDCPPVWIPQPTDRHREVLGPLLRTQGGKSNLVLDAHLAALAIEHGLTLCTSDGDFARFPGLRWQNPLL